MRASHALPRRESAGSMRNTMKREYDFSKAKRGPVIRVPKGQTRITIPLDDHVLDWFRRQVDEAGGATIKPLSTLPAKLRSTGRGIHRGDLAACYSGGDAPCKLTGRWLGEDWRPSTTASRRLRRVVWVRPQRSRRDT